MRVAGSSESRHRAWVVLAAALAGTACTARLGVWQLDRAAQKEAMQSALEARSALPALDSTALPATEQAATLQHYRPVRLRGDWQQGATVYLDNRQMNGRPGFFVLTPLRIGPRDAVLVQRGWMPRDMQDRTRLQNLATPSGPVEVWGQVAPAPARLFEFSAAAAASGPIRQNLALADFSRELGLPLRPWSVLQADSPATAGDGLLRQWPRPAADVHKHYGYAFQWFALCALMAGLYVWFQLLRPRLRRPD